MSKTVSPEASRWCSSPSRIRAQTAFRFRGSFGLGIHGAHLGPNVQIRYNSDPSRQMITWIEYTDSAGKKISYGAPGTSAAPAGMNFREMDCLDCHNRPSHTFQTADAALNQALASGRIPGSLPFIKKQALAVVQQPYASKNEAQQKIFAAIDGFYRTGYPDLYRERQAEIKKAGDAVLMV